MYCTKLATEFELVIEKMQEQDIFIFQTILHMIGLQNKKVSIIIGLCGQINFMCFKLAIMKEHQKMIRSLTLILLEQCDQMIPQLCENFNFVKELEINLNNFALNFDHLP